jgi:putative phage-type endonuclease
MSATATLSIGGSEAAAACGLNPYTSRVQLWLEKTGKVEREPAGEQALWDNLLQPVIAAEVGRRGFSTVPAPADSFRSDEYPWMSGHLDGFVGSGDVGYSAVTGSALNLPSEGDAGDSASPLPVRPPATLGVLEVKTAGIRQAPLWDDNETPTAYALQAHHYMILTDCTWALVACLIGGQRLELRVLERDARVCELLLQLEAAFVQLVEADTPPAPDGSESADRMLKLLYPRAHGFVKLTSDDKATVEALKKLKTQEKRVAAQIKAAEQELRDRLGEASVGMFDGLPLVRYPNVTQHRFSQSEFRAAHPELWNEFKRESTYRRLSLV